MTAEYEIEPIRGLPEPLPAGEHILWQGEPQWQVLLRRMFHARKLAVYFGVLLVWQLASMIHDGTGPIDLVIAMSWLVAVAAAGLGLLALLAWLTARATVYTITNQRIVMRFGVALPMTVNIPFGIVKSAGLKVYDHQVGDIPMALMDSERVSYLIMWPHVRPWRFGRAEPMLRAIPEAPQVAELLADALSTSAALSALPARAEVDSPSGSRPARRPPRSSTPANADRVSRPLAAAVR